MCSHLDNSVSPVAMALAGSQEGQRDDVQNRRGEGRQPGFTIVSKLHKSVLCVLRIDIKLQLTFKVVGYT